jgi:tripartite-type tricarboxylate transporter receptor subunit TctC
MIRVTHWAAALAFTASGLLAVLPFDAAVGQAQESYPSKPIQLIVTTAAGGSGDLVARAVAERLSEFLRQPIVIENQPAANGGVAATQVARANPDGHTLLFTADSTLATNPHLYKNLSYDPFGDLAPVSIAAKMPMVLLTSASFQPNSIQDLVALAKANPGKFNYASTGLGTQLHIGFELFKMMTKTDIVHVPYRANTAVLADIMGGRVEMVLIGQPAAKAQQNGKVKLLGIAALQRSALLPDVPTISEAGVPGYEVSAWYGILAPAKTPQAVIDRLAMEMKRVGSDPRFVASIASQGLDIIASSPSEMLQAMRADSEKWGGVIRATGTTINQ